MLPFSLHWLVPGVLSVALSGANFAVTAQTAPLGRGPDPLDARAAVPAVGYESALTRSRRSVAQERAVSWREANDTAARIGGWRAYAREAQQPDPAPAPSPAGQAPRTDPAKPSPAGHSGHKTP